MQLPSKEQILALLKPLGIEATALANNPANLKKACAALYQVIPIPFRWFVGKKRIKQLLLAAAASASHATGNVFSMADAEICKK